jgi:hypothetical protein
MRKRLWLCLARICGDLSDVLLALNAHALARAVGHKGKKRGLR